MAEVEVQHPNGGPTFPPTSLYVGDLDQSVTDSQVYDVFNQVGQVVSVRVCRDVTTRRSLGYAYVNYTSPQDAARALELLNFTPLNTKTIRVMYSNRDPSTRKSGTANIFIKIYYLLGNSHCNSSWVNLETASLCHKGKAAYYPNPPSPLRREPLRDIGNLDRSIDNKALHDTFSSFGNILSCKIATDPTGQSRGYGFVQFDNEESAQSAIEKLNGMLMNEKQVYVAHFLRKHERESETNKTKFNNVYVKNLSESVTDEEMKNIFSAYGTITSAIVMRDADGKSKCFGFVNFEDADDAAKAVEALNGKMFGDKEWYVSKAQKKSERVEELKSSYEQSAKEAADKHQGSNLYIKNLDDSIDEDKLKELFSEFGTITSTKVMRDPSGASKGSGFVAFSTPDEASKAISEMNGRMVVSKTLYVAIAQRKEERRERFQVRPVGIASTVAPRFPFYPPGAPGMGQLFYGQAPAAMLPQAGFGYQQQLIPGMRPGAAPMPNYFVPMQQGQRPGGRRGAGPVQHAQQPVPMMQPQMLPRGRMHRYPHGRNVPEVPMSGVSGGMLSAPFDMGGRLPRGDASIPQPSPITTLASALANAAPEHQRSLLGENLYPLVDQLEHEHAAKVTGMLLEMDQTEVLHLLDTPEALKTKVSEAMGILQKVEQAPADQLASLSLNDNLGS